MPYRFDRDLELQRRAIARRAAPTTVASAISFFRIGDHVVVVAAADLAAASCSTGTATREAVAAICGAQAEVVVELLDRRPTDFEADDLTRRAATEFVDAARAPDEWTLLELHQPAETHFSGV